MKMASIPVARISHIADELRHCIQRQETEILDVEHGLVERRAKLAKLRSELKEWEAALTELID